jgi:hypothetical protein
VGRFLTVKRLRRLVTGSMSSLFSTLVFAYRSGSGEATISLTQREKLEANGAEILRVLSAG